MAAGLLDRRGAIAVRNTRDRAVLRAFLERDRLFAAYSLCDLEDLEFGRTRWGIATVGDQVVAVGMEYSGPTPQPLFLMGDVDGIGALLRDVIRPRAAYVSAASESLPTIGRSYRVEPGPPMIRMWVDRASFRPFPAAVERLLPVEANELNRLYQLGFAAWLPSTAVAEGIYFGIRVNGRLIAAAGTHVISRDARLAVVGNVLTHAEHRGRGYAKATTSAVTAELLRFCDQVVLNVRSDNPPAIAAYRHLGYVEHCRLEERLIRRTGSQLADLTAPIRRLFAQRPWTPRRPRPRSPRPTRSPRWPTPTEPRSPDDRRHAQRAARRDGPRPRRRGRPPHRVGRARDARPAPDPCAVRAGEAARRPAHRGVPPRHHRDREPDAHAEGGRRGGPPRGVEPAVDAGRHGGGPGRRVRHRHLRAAGRGQRRPTTPTCAPSRIRTPPSPWTTAATSSRCSTANAGTSCPRFSRAPRRPPPASSASERWRPTAPSRSRSWP